MIRYSAQKISARDVFEVKKTLKSDFITQGKKNLLFEKKISSFVGSKYCSTTNSASSALLLACKAIGLSKNDIAWTTTNTFAATANAIQLTGAKIDFVDIDLHTFNISTNELKKKLAKTKKNMLPKAIIIVHFGGLPCELKEIYKLAKKYKFRIIEDASHALGAEYYNNKIGNCRFSDITIFSFHAIKIITTCEGGAITTNNLNYYKKINLLRTNGINKNRFNLKNKKWYYEQSEIGYNFRLNEVQAALGLSQISKIKSSIKKRNQIAKMYSAGFQKLPVEFQNISKNIISSYHLFTILIKKKNKRNKLYNYLLKKKIETNVVYIPLYRHPIYRKDFKLKKFSSSEKYYEESLSLPMHLNLTKKQIDYIIKSIKSFFDE